MSVSTILIILLILFLFGALPVHTYSADWGYAPSSVLGILLIVLVVLILVGKLKI